ncbi:MAG: ECF transporter S component, partial [Chloroflexi bacterium]|nr:ECF transporter S component [Chloroflexota bacterium]
MAVASERAIRRVTTAGLLLAITLLLVFTSIGMFPVPTPAGHATIAHIPAIIGGILEGPLVGLLVGMGFGFASFARATIPMFKDPLVAIVP